MTRASDNAYPSLLITEGTEPSAPAAGKQRVYIDSTTHKLKRTDSSGVDVTIESNSATPLASGTSFPGSPATNDLFHRTDRNLIYFYDGTRWLSITTHEAQFPLTDAAINGTVAATVAVGIIPIPWLGAYSLWLDHVDFGYQVSTNSGVNYWEFQLNYYTNVGGRNAIVVADTSALAASSNGTITVSIAALLNAAAVNFELRVVKHSSPANLFAWGAHVHYRLVG